MCDIPITITQATLGAELEIPMVDGEKVKYKIPEATQTGTRFTIRNKGFKAINGNWQGDFIFTVNVQTPKKLTKEQRDLLTQLAKTMNEQPPVKKRGLFDKEKGQEEFRHSFLTFLDFFWKLRLRNVQRFFVAVSRSL